ncbi:MAG: protease-4 [Bacteroidia bacterium]|jgi:protease-4
MKQFFKFVLATFTGLILSGFFVILIISLWIGSMSKNENVTLKENSVLVVKLNHDLKDNTSDNPFDAFFSELSPDVTKALGLYDVLKDIKAAKSNDNIEGIFLDLTFVSAGYGKLSEVREALEDFKSEGKFIYAYGEVMYNKTYYLASVADQIYLNPSGELLFNGMVADVTFLKKTLAKMGIEMQAVKKGKFKGAIEPFVLDEMSEANRMQITAFMNSIHQNTMTTISKARGIDLATLQTIADSMLVRNADDAVILKMIDKVAYRDEVISAILAKVELEDEDDLNWVSLSKFNTVVQQENKFKKDKIAIIFAEGSIVSGNGEEGEIGSDKFAKALKDARLDDDVKAVVLRINSGGGSALASEVIWRETMLLKAKKPLIVSMGDVAASGGYYIAALADTIVANPSTITGSIGVFGMFPNAKGLYDKLGLHSEYITTAEHADFGRIDRPLNDFEKDFLQEIISKVYGEFLTRVSDGRGLPRNHVDSIAEGRVYTGVMAKELGLIDVEGGLNKAIAIAASKAGIEKYGISAYPKNTNPFASFMTGFGGASLKEKWMKEELGVMYETYKEIKAIQGMSGVQAILPYSFNIK